MSLQPTILSDGSSPDDAHPTVQIDRSDAIERYRYTCPNGHIDWDRTNNHVWCRSCREQAEHGVDIDPEHWVIYDKREDREIPWHAVELVSDRGNWIPKSAD